MKRFPDISARTLGKASIVGALCIGVWGSIYSGFAPEVWGKVRDALFAPPPPPEQKLEIPVVQMNAGADDTGAFFFTPSVTVPACTKDFKIARLTVEAGTPDEKQPADIQAALLEAWTAAVADQDSTNLSLDNDAGRARIRALLDGIAQDAETASGLKTAFRVGLPLGITISAPVDDQYSNCRREGEAAIPSPVQPRAAQRSPDNAKSFGKWDFPPRQHVYFTIVRDRPEGYTVRQEMSGL